MIPALHATVGFHRKIKDLVLQVTERRDTLHCRLFMQFERPVISHLTLLVNLRNLIIF